MHDRIHSLFPPALAVNIWVTRYSRDPGCPAQTPALRLRSIWLECTLRKLRKSLYRPKWPSPNLCDCCSPTFAGKLDFGRVGATSATDLPMLWFAGVARKAWMLPASGPLSTDCHARDLSALVDLVSHGCEEVGTGRKQRVEVGHHAVLPDEGMGPVEVGVQVCFPPLGPCC